MNKETVEYMKDKLNKYEQLSAKIENHKHLLGKYEKSLPLSVNFNFGSQQVILDPKFKEQVIEVIKEQLNMYEQIINEL